VLAVDDATLRQGSVLSGNIETDATDSQRWRQVLDGTAGILVEVREVRLDCIDRTGTIIHCDVKYPF
jgi:hypothetical protein